MAQNVSRHLVEQVWILHQLGQTGEARQKAEGGLERFPDHSGLQNFLNNSQ